MSIAQQHHNLKSDAATEPMARWLISSAEMRTTLTYGQAKERLETECDFSTIYPHRVGVVAGALIDKILEYEPSAPLLTVLLVGQDTRLPRKGVRKYLHKRFPREKWLAGEDAHARYSDRWQAIIEKAVYEVYAYRRWRRLYEHLYKKDYIPDSVVKDGKERDGFRRGRRGEGENHKALRLWVKDNPEQVGKNLCVIRTETEVELLSGDRVDVVYYTERETVAIEVKSRDSNWADLRRGIYQCVKYRAVLRAQDHLREDPPVYSLLVTEKQLPGDLNALAKKLDVRHLVVPLDRKE